MSALPDTTPSAVVGVAASAGGVEALTRFVRHLPADFPAAVLIVLHLSESGPSVLPAILGRATTLGVAQARDGEPLRPGRVVVAPPGQHLRVKDGVARLDRGPKENGHRPSADALLRSLAETYGSRAAGVVLSGTMVDGAAGLRALAHAGGFCIVQDPGEAAFPGMPRAALAEVGAALVRPVAAIGGALAAWVTSLPDEDPPAPPMRSAAHDSLSVFTCPECGGTLRVEHENGAERYRCRVGHAFSPEALMAGKQDALEAALWAAVVALEEHADLCRRILGRLERTGRTSMLERYRAQVEFDVERIDTIRALIDHLGDHLALPVTSGDERCAEET